MSNQNVLGLLGAIYAHVLALENLDIQFQQNNRRNELLESLLPQQKQRESDGQRIRRLMIDAWRT